MKQNLWKETRMMFPLDFRMREHEPCAELASSFEDDHNRGDVSHQTVK